MDEYDNDNPKLTLKGLWIPLGLMMDELCQQPASSQSPRDNRRLAEGHPQTSKGKGLY